MDIIANDKILPPSWIQPAITKQWYTMLGIQQLTDVGPQNVPADLFERE